MPNEKSVITIEIDDSNATGEVNLDFSATCVFNTHEPVIKKIMAALDEICKVVQ